MGGETRRAFLARAGVIACGFTGRVGARPASAFSQQHGTVIADARKFLCARQSHDGAWRSQQYAAFREGDALTPLVVYALQCVAEPNPITKDGIARGMEWLRNVGNAQARNPEPWRNLVFPLFSGAYATQIFATVGDRTAMESWLKIVEALRIRPGLGWPPNSPATGAWGDATEPPQASSDIGQTPDMIAPNISATALALDAFSAAGQGRAARDAIGFIMRCQNFAETNSTRFDDGGFFYALDDSVRNKAGISGIDDAGTERYRSYGSATCDGILALRAAGSDRNDPRCLAALQWLARETHDAVNAGRWPIERQDAREALFYYHAQGFGRVLSLAETIGALNPLWIRAERDALFSALEKRQRIDGSWSGSQPDSCEDDPLVATSFALRALTQPAQSL